MNTALLFSDQFIRFYLVCIHMLAAGIALGTIASSYLRLVFSGTISRQSIKIEHNTVLICFGILFLSGALIIYLDLGTISSFTQILHQKKLITKMVIVAAIILNGIFIRYYTIDKILTQNKFSKRTILLFCISSGISMSSWISAILIGKAKIFVGILTLEGFIFLYLLILYLGITGGIIAARFINLDGKIVD